MSVGATMFALPPGWAWTTLRDISEIQGGVQKQPSRTPKENASPYLRVANVLRGKLDLSAIQYMELFDGELERLRLRDGDLLIVEGNGSKTEIGRSALWKDEIPNCIHQNHIIRVRLREGDPKFFDYYWNSATGNRQVVRVAASTSGLYTLSISKVGSLPVPVAPIPEQRRVVAILDELITDIDTGVLALERARANLRRYRAAILKAAVTGELTAEWRAAHPNVEPAHKLLERILGERRRNWEAFNERNGGKKKYVEPEKPDANCLPDLPPGWCWAHIEQVADLTRYGSSAKTNSDSSGVPVARMGNIQEGNLVLDEVKYLPHAHSEFPDLFLEAGDLLFNRTNSAELVGKTAVYKGDPKPCSYASYLIAVRMLPGCIADLVAYFINSTLGRHWVKSVATQQCGQANVNGTKLQALAIPLPPLAEQNEVVKEVEQHLSLITATGAYIDASLNRAERLRQSILNEAFAGRLAPQDPSDEPATVLLDRMPRPNGEAKSARRPKKLARGQQ